MKRALYKLPLTHKTAKTHFNYHLNGRVTCRYDIVELRLVQDIAEWWQPVPEPRQISEITLRKGQTATSEHEGKLWVCYNGVRCLATDFIGFLKYGRWFRYDPIDGDWCNLKWGNLRRMS